jgi:hypothetical protein
MGYNTYLASLGPLAWWKLDDPAGSATVADSSGNGYTGTVNGGVTLGEVGPGTGGTSALFDGSTGYIATDANSSYAAFSIIAWLNLPAAVGGAQGVLVGYLANGSSISGAVSPNTIVGEGWTMAALTYDGNTITLYLNGSPVGSASFSGSGSGAVLGMGVYGSDYWPGYLAQIAVLDFPLTAREISNLYNAVSGAGLGAGGGLPGGAGLGWGGLRPWGSIIT